MAIIVVVPARVSAPITASTPREQAFMRMIDIDPSTAVLISSYANIVDIVQGPRMALIIEPGGGACPEKFTLADER